mmetsp:Transcript_23148/g.39175  ORF Transcript_23148/g.39175 Transcript_23148/m.39175 type:complete len:84 (+) Transcript_23148:202-453(+)
MIIAASQHYHRINVFTFFNSPSLSPFPKLKISSTCTMFIVIGGSSCLEFVCGTTQCVQEECARIVSPRLGVSKSAGQRQEKRL